MKAFFVSVMMILLVAASVTAMHNYEVSEDYTLLNMIEESDITAVGTVALVTGVYIPSELLGTRRYDCERHCDSCRNYD